MKTNNWQKRYGAKRRATDRAVLAEAEKTIRLEDIQTPADRIARAFGRPEHEKAVPEVPVGTA